MTIGRRWKPLRYHQLRSYLFRRFRRIQEPFDYPNMPLTCAPYDRYVQLLTALERRQKEAMC